MPKVPVRKPGSAGRVVASLPEVQEISMDVVPRAITATTPKRPTEGSMPHHEGSTCMHKWVKMTVGKHKSRCGEGSSRAHSKGKESDASGEEPTQPAYCCPKSMKELCGTMMRKDDEGYYALKMTDLPPRDPDSEIWARWEALKNSARVWDDP
ncbi:hypothetical protein BHE74_00021987 [Ensete ventricosum]|nr:hypothetical protein GW17_00043483 [Ensete ventricosum]RWW70335.1 hypothetical protein BHE74_00021987 [Ensete ventricosum]RZS02917.1 hypothetical protein BHM03_00033020 [Ensete ventricosum]